MLELYISLDTPAFSHIIKATHEEKSANKWDSYAIKKKLEESGEVMDKKMT